jgi:hypothetical protein
MASVIDTDSVLAIDIGSATTRAMLFDIVEGRYRFVAIGQAPSTLDAPVNDVLVGVGDAIGSLEKITGRTFIDNSTNSIISSLQADGSGVDAIAATISAGPPLRAVVAGLLADVSLESAKNLIASTYARVIETISLNDTRPAEEQIDAILKANPDLIVIAGGTDGGASNSLQSIIEVIGLAAYLMPKDKKPAVLFVGNKEMDEEVKELLAPLSSSLHTAPNIRPSIDTEDLLAARKELAQAVVAIRKQQFSGVDEVDMWTGGHLLPSIFTEGRIVNLLSKLYGTGKAVLSVNLGASATTVTAGFGDRLFSHAYPEYGMGSNVTEILEHTTTEEIARWLPMDISPERINNYIYAKALYPTSIPATKDELQMEQALGREALRLALSDVANNNMPSDVPALKKDLLPLFEVILAGGSVISNAPTPGQSLLILLDALQPVGISTVILDQNNLLPALGAAASVNTILPIQALETGAFSNLATVVAPISTARYGSAILKASLRRPDGSVSTVDVKQGGFEVLSLKLGEVGDLSLQPRGRTDIGKGAGKKIAMKVGGSALGVVIDGRGRPLDLTSDNVRRRDLMKKWLWSLGG